MLLRFMVERFKLKQELTKTEDRETKQELELQIKLITEKIDMILSYEEESHGF